MATLLGGETQCPGLPSSIGFEGYEKRLEITFFPASTSADPETRGLRALSRAQIDFILEAAQCTIVSQLSNQSFDSYVLSESSLFIYPHKIIIKTCGTTRLLLAIPRILTLAADRLLSVSSARYSRGSFTFPDLQPAPHRSFSEEVAVLNIFFGGLSSGGRAYVLNDMSSPGRSWHVYYATHMPEPPATVTVEMCMTGLDSRRAAIFFKEVAAAEGSPMTELAGIQAIMPEMEICDHEFEPCGYSMNGANGPALSSIHVAPEDGSSYASYEAMGFDPAAVDCSLLVERVLRSFRPAEFSMAVTIFGGRRWAGSWGREVGAAGYARRHVIERELPGGGLLVYQSFSLRETSVVPLLGYWRREEEEAEMAAGFKVMSRL
ncbi:unnamed protein product [Spirodela intermedia]|uniref:adenosylmethionine decarboxylase n=2 Tax=Spirodela intermedia TaxID=51605 RepID=A0A7I8LH74_SPIIN|nr:unnamed protein product [Spirodela intermedia]CAA6672231.1 unnamed protein product [Spirodela intermedia]CAA7409387.1 unnamed protein product [Spirodela intermedia]